MFIRKLSAKSDDELMELLHGGNSAALDELYRRYSGKLLRYFFRMLWKDESKAQDFLHDLFLKIIQNPQAFQTGRNFSTWIYSVANNMCKNEYRREAIRKAANANSDGVVNLYQNEAADETVALLESAVQCLDEDEKHLYALRYEVEMSIEEIATLLDCPPGTVKSRIFYVKKKLAATMKTGNKEKFRYGIQ